MEITDIFKSREYKLRKEIEKSIIDSHDFIHLYSLQNNLTNFKIKQIAIDIDNKNIKSDDNHSYNIMINLFQRITKILDKYNNDIEVYKIYSQSLTIHYIFILEHYYKIFSIIKHILYNYKFKKVSYNEFKKYIDTKIEIYL